MKKKILIAGEINVDLILQNYHSFPELGKEVLVDDCFLTLGSASLICAMGLAKLGDDVSFLGKVGCDAYGDFCLERMEKAGIDISRVIRDPKLKTGITVSVSSPRDRALITYLGAITELRAEDIRDEALRGFNHVHVSSYFLQEGLRYGVRDVFSRAPRPGPHHFPRPGIRPLRAVELRYHRDPRTHQRVLPQRGGSGGHRPFDRFRDRAQGHRQRPHPHGGEVGAAGRHGA